MLWNWRWIHNAGARSCPGLRASPVPEVNTDLYPERGSVMLFRMTSLILKYICAAAFFLPLCGCLTQRTVSEGGHKVSQEYIIKRPLKEAVQNSR